MIPRLLVSLAVLVVAVPVSAAYFRPAWARSVGLDVWNMPTLHEQVAAAAEQQRELDTQGADVRERIDVKETIIANLVEGHLTLRDAVSRFTALNRANPVACEVIDIHYPGSSHEIKAARNVIDYAYARLVTEPVWVRLAVLARIELQFVAMVTEEACHDAQ